MATLEFEFDPRSQRYRYTSGAGKGQFVSRDAVENLVNKAIEQDKQEIRELCQNYSEGKITYQEWKLGIASTTKRSTIQLYTLGKGGKEQLTPKDRGKMGGMLNYQMGKLDNFAYEVKKGQISEAQLAARSELYIQKTREAFEEGRRESHKDNGYKWEKRVINSKEHCPDCINYASMGWQPIGTLPRPCTQCQCRANCRCKIVYSKSDKKPTTADWLIKTSGKSGWL